jgi:hypothetical protein
MLHQNTNYEVGGDVTWSKPKEQNEWTYISFLCEATFVLIVLIDFLSFRERVTETSMIHSGWA